MPKKSSKFPNKEINKKIIKESSIKIKEDLAKEKQIQKTRNSKSTTKNSRLIEIIKAAEDGITIKQICENLKWQPHTARSAISRLNKNQNLGIINDKIAGGDRVYKIPKKD